MKFEPRKRSKGLLRLCAVSHSNQIKTEANIKILWKVIFFAKMLVGSNYIDGKICCCFFNILLNLEWNVKNCVNKLILIIQIN